VQLLLLLQLLGALLVLRCQLLVLPLLLGVAAKGRHLATGPAQASSSSAALQALA
jgi:hypothetical protein